MFSLSPVTKLIIGGIALAAIAVTAIALGQRQFKRGVTAGENKVITDVQSTTIQAQEKARVDREKINEEVRETPYDGRVDQLK